MKKIILTIGVFLILNCELKFKETRAQNVNNLVCYSNSCITYKVRVLEGMEFGIFYVNYNGGDPGDVFVINLTKDALEVKLLQEQLKAYNHGHK